MAARRCDHEESTVSVMAGHSRSKNGVASLAYVPAISTKEARLRHGNRDRRDKPGDDADGLACDRL
jgi:hypothetical protein